MHRFTNINGINLIKHYEGFKPKPYFCIAGCATIGFGHKILASENFTYLTEAEAETLLAADLYTTEKAVIRLINTCLTDDQFAALVSFTFNLGGSALQRSTLRQKVNYGLFQECSEEFLKWCCVGGRKISGLIRRRTSEVKLFNSVYI